jgi:hypothetical protein
MELIDAQLEVKDLFQGVLQGLLEIAVFRHVVFRHFWSATLPEEGSVDAVAIRLEPITPVIA